MDHSLVWLNENMSHAVQGHPRWMGHGGEFWHRGEGNGKPLPYSCLENPTDSMEEPKFSIYSLWHHLWRILEWSVMVFKGSHSVKKDTWILNVRKKKRKKNHNTHGKNCSVYLTKCSIRICDTWKPLAPCYIGSFGVYDVCRCMWGFWPYGRFF